MFSYVKGYANFQKMQQMYINFTYVNIHPFISQYLYIIEILKLHQ